MALLRGLFSPHGQGEVRVSSINSFRSSGPGGCKDEHKSHSGLLEPSPASERCSMDLVSLVAGQRI